MTRFWRRWYERFGIEQPFPWLLCALLPVSVLCAAAAHAWWWASQTQPISDQVPNDVDIKLREIADRTARKYRDWLPLHESELATAIHARLRNKYRQMRDAGELYRDSYGQIRLTGEPDAE